jgi:hypothetical protein
MRLLQQLHRSGKPPNHYVPCCGQSPKGSLCTLRGIRCPDVRQRAQFSSAEFAKKWSFEHQTSSPRYPQSNGKPENAVKTIKRLFNKCRESGQSALLDWRNTPTEGVGTSPAQRFLGRRCKTLLPTTHVRLKPQYPTDDAAQALLGQKAKQRHYYNRQVNDLSPIQEGDGVRVQLPGEKTWTPSVCTGSRGTRSYGVRVGGQEFRRNRRQLLHTQEQVETEGDLPPTREPQTLADQPVHRGEALTPIPPDAVGPTTTSPPCPALQSLRRSERSRKPPDWFVPS